jgi:hypothetical protein
MQLENAYGIALSTCDHETDGPTSLPVICKICCTPISLDDISTVRFTPDSNDFALQYI